MSNPHQHLPAGGSASPSTVVSSPPGGTVLHIIEPPTELYHQTFRDDPGAMWRWPDLDREGREAWVIVLPNRAGLWWTTYLADGTDQMWNVSGEPPRITVAPSINAGDKPGVGNWHGWITDGVMVP